MKRKTPPVLDAMAGVSNRAAVAAETKRWMLEAVDKFEARKRLDSVADVVLAYRPKSKRKKPRKRKKAKRDR